MGIERSIVQGSDKIQTRKMPDFLTIAVRKPPLNTPTMQSDEDVGNHGHSGWHCWHCFGMPRFIPRRPVASFGASEWGLFSLGVSFAVGLAVGSSPMIRKGYVTRPDVKTNPSCRGASD